MFAPRIKSSPVPAALAVLAIAVTPIATILFSLAYLAG